jgi:hypothetical protein
MHRLPEWITAIGTIVTAGGVLLLRKQIDLLWKQLELMGIQVKADHERSQRENSINYLFEWSKGLLRSSSLARRLAEELDPKQTKALAKEEELALDKAHKELVMGVLTPGPHYVLKETAHEIVLDKSQVADIRWQLVRYLNNLESIFVAARHGVANEEILIEQFDYLYDERQGHHILQNLREALGGAKAYPALHELEKKLTAKHGPAAPLGTIQTSLPKSH